MLLLKVPGRPPVWERNKPITSTGQPCASLAIYTFYRVVSFGPYNTL